VSQLVALDARLTRQLSVGMKTYVRELTARLPAAAPDLRFRIFDKGGNFGWGEQIRLPLAIRAAKPALTHFMSQYTPAFLLPKPYVVTIHDLIHLVFPKNFKRKVGPYYRSVVRRVAAGAARVITDDTRTVADLQRYLGIAPERVRVVPLGVEDVFLQPIIPPEMPRPYFFYSGNHRDHKDLRTLFAAWQALPLEIEADLLLTGNDDAGWSKLSRSNSSAVFLGTLSPGELARYYAGAVALVHPALREGFGLPMLEAMAARAPVIASDSALPAVLQGAALTFRAGDARSAAAAMRSVLADQGLRSKLVNEGRARAETLTWERCARETADVYREVLRASDR
jgi:glycosyltransferase involved in cell wall biosynthesis